MYTDGSKDEDKVRIIYWEKITWSGLHGRDDGDNWRTSGLRR